MSFSIDKLGNQFLNGELTNIQDKSIFDNVKLIGIYIGADWAIPCKKFLPSLIEFYNNSNKDQKQLEIIYISMDNLQSTFENQIKQMPFPALAWENVQRYKIYQILKDKIDGIPALIIFDKDGNIVVKNGRGQVEYHHQTCFDQWLQVIQ